MVGPVNFSVAMCTCNGAQFLGEQLASLASQTYLPGELVVCDDASLDGTWELLENFKKNAPFPTQLHRNASRLGIGKNFEQAIRLCKGDIIAICDQDDVWSPKKLQRFANFFSMGVDAVCCNAQLTDEVLNPLGYTLWDRVAFDASERQMAGAGHLMEVLLKHDVIAGATLAFRSDSRDQLLPIPTNWLYDAWLAAVLAACGSLVIVDESLQQYRQHQMNAIGGRRQSFFSQLRSAFNVIRSDYLGSELCRWQQFSGWLDAIQEVNNSSWQIRGKKEHLARRLHFPENRLRRIPYVVAEVVKGGYARFSRNWGSVALDLLIK